MKRFYTRADMAAVAGGFTVTLDGRPVRTPAGKPLILPHQALAAAIVAEWQEQGDMVDPHAMPMMQLASTALDRVGPSRAAIIDQLLKYAGTDLLCYRADSPRDLVIRQEEIWQPVVDWVCVSLGAEMVVTSGVVPIRQADEALAALRRVIDGYDDWKLTALQAAVAAMGSLLLGLALVEGRLDGSTAFEASQLDETYQIELWGEDPEATRRRTVLRNDVASAARLLELCLPCPPPMHS